MARRPLVLRSGDAVLAEVERLSRDGCTSRGTWDLPQTLWHLAESMEQSVNGRPWPGPDGWKKLVGRLALPVVLVLRRLPAGAPAPAPLIPPDVPPADVRARLEAAVRLVERATSFIPHPVFGAMAPRHWREIHWIHAAHHLSSLVTARDLAGT